MAALPPPGLVVVRTAKGGVSPLTSTESLGGSRGGKWWKRRAAVTARTPRASRASSALVATVCIASSRAP